MASEPLSYREVMATEALTPTSPFEATTLDFVFGQVWARPGISRKQRRLVTLTCVCAADATGPIDDHMYAALATGDLKIEELLEFTCTSPCTADGPRRRKPRRASAGSMLVFRRSGAVRLSLGPSTRRPHSAPPITKPAWLAGSNVSLT